MSDSNNVIKLPTAQIDRVRPPGRLSRIIQWWRGWRRCRREYRWEMRLLGRRKAVDLAESAYMIWLNRGKYYRDRADEAQRRLEIARLDLKYEELKIEEERKRRK